MASTSIPVFTVDAAGFHMPAFADIVAGIQAAYSGIYGQDIIFDNSDQDTQWLGILAAAFADYGAAALGVYNDFSPATAQGVGLSSVVKVNGIARKVASYSTATVTVIGQPRTYANVLVGDGTYTWALPASFTIPATGTIDLTATCTTIGAVSAQAGEITNILTPTLGLQSVSNAEAATLGASVETDAELRVRQSQSTMLPSQTVGDGITAAIEAIPGVTRYRVYENDTNTQNALGIPGHSVAYVIDGGDDTAICSAIALKKTQGTGTYGTASQVVPVGLAQVPRQIRFSRPIEPRITVNIAIQQSTNYTLDTEAAIQAAVAAYINGLGIGNSVQLTRVLGAALLTGTAASSLFEIVSVVMGRDGAVPQASDIPIAFNEAPFCLPTDINPGYVP